MCTYTCTMSCILCVYDVPRPGRMDLCTSSVVLCNGRLLYFDRGREGRKREGIERERERERERETERKGGREKNRERVRDSTKHHYIMSRNC